ncbi:FixH family protein [Natrinema salsiterrestre]|uniref:FixH family protein n=1 Tax=Natrinema salsiterrestre TaxID=2950540 RepID=A0A9Q4KZH8_9EURY|nr:FixH family protein [Natrinema salsiterrestre]MDF9747055.1 FixH family protein [Natrinema salsiterrestre]
MQFGKRLLVVGTIAVLLVGTVGPAVAHETQDLDGNEVTFGGADEPLITGERMWLEFEIVDAESGEPVENLSENLTVSIQTGDHEKTALELSEKHGEPGVYEAPVVFTESGDYVVHLEGSIDGSAVHTHFEKEVHDRAELEYPGTDSETNDTSASSTDGNQTSLSGIASGVGTAVAVGAVGVLAIGVALVRRRR